MVKRGRMEKEDEMPELGRYQPLLLAFSELSTERQIGMSVGPIPVSAIRRHLAEFSLPDWWLGVLRRVDNTYLTDMQTQAEAS